jgi:protein involved in polysaccharide export with SLBB domain
MKKIFAIALLSLAITACESNPTDNANTPKPTSTPATTPAPATPVPEVSPAAKVELKAGDKVKVMVNGVATEATIVSVNEKTGKATVKIPGQKEDRTITTSEIVKQ